MILNLLHFILFVNIYPYATKKLLADVNSGRMFGKG